jgi:hypothetical protein
MRILLCDDHDMKKARHPDGWAIEAPGVIGRVS